MKSSLPGLMSLVLIVMLSGVSSLFGQDAPKPWETKPMEADPAAVRKAAEAIPAPAGAEIQILLDQEVWRFDEQGRLDRSSYLIYKVLGKNGADNWDDISYSWAPWHEEKPRLEARVLLANGSVKTLDPATILESASADQDGDLYSDRRKLQAPLPAVEPGVIVEQRISFKETRSIFDSGVVYRSLMGSSMPLDTGRVILDYPASLKLKTGTQLLDKLKPAITQENGRIKAVYEIRNPDKWKAIPACLPSDQVRRPGVIFSTGASWQAIAAAYAQVVDQKIAGTDLSGIISGVCGSANSPEDRIKAIISWVAKEIRYTGIEFGESAYVPFTPTEVLNRKYGDCKDKASLMVALLRAAGLKADVALLLTGPGQDTNPDFPGMGGFDHAIVHVDYGKGLWIDATDNYARMGQIPSQDQGRFALVANKSTTGLVKIPQTPSSENLLGQNRKVTLSDFGNALVIETSSPAGYLESRYRAFFSYRQTDARLTWAKSYAGEQFISDTVDSLTTGDPGDLSVPFSSTLAMSKVKRGYTDLDSAVYYIRYESLFDRLPDEILKIHKKPTAGDKDADAPRSADWELPQAYRDEITYTITPPQGFISRGMPANRLINLGPAVLSETYEAQADGSIKALISFDTIKSRYTAKEAEALAQAAADLQAKPATALQFEPSGKVLLDEGKPQEAFASYHALLASQPGKAIHHLRYARALLGIGLGEAARQEAKKAVELEPSSAIAWRILGDILRSDTVGRFLRLGSDIPGAKAAYLKSLELDPNDTEVRGNLAIMCEYNSKGQRYGEGAPLDQAISNYRSLGSEASAELGLGNNLMYALLYNQAFDQVLQEAETMEKPPLTPVLAALAATKGVDAALDLARQKITSESERCGTLRSAGESLMGMRHYQEASLLYTAGAYGDSASQTNAFAALLKRLKPWEEVLAGPDTPVKAVQTLLVRLCLDYTLSDGVKACLSDLVLADPASADSGETLLGSFDRGGFASLRRADFAPRMIADIMLQLVEYRQDGSDETGWKIRLRMQGAPDCSFVVLKETRGYKVLDVLKSDAAYVGRLVMQKAQAGNLAGARKLLDWTREEVKGGSVDDPLAGSIFARCWSKGQNGDAVRIKAAGALLMLESSLDTQACIKALKAAWEAEAPGTAKDMFQLGLANIYNASQDYPAMAPLAQDLSQRYPGSDEGLYLAAIARIGMKDSAGAEQILKTRLAEDPHSHLALWLQVLSSQAQENFVLADQRIRGMVDSGDANDSDLNLLAWNALFTRKTSSGELDTILKVIQGNKNGTAYLHTLACVYTELGKLKDSYDTLIQSMDIMGQIFPSDDYRYAFGRMAEQSGLPDIARSLYQSLKRPRSNLEYFTSSFYLAQARLKDMKLP